MNICHKLEVDVRIKERLRLTCFVVTSCRRATEDLQLIMRLLVSVEQEQLHHKFVLDIL